MPKQNKPGIPQDIPIQLTAEQIAGITELAELSGKTFQETLDEVVNEVLAKELPGVIERALKNRK